MQSLIGIDILYFCLQGLASFVLVMQNHPKLVTSNAKAFHIKCIYQTGEQNVTLAFNVSMLTTAGTIANTGPPPTCSMRIVSRTGDEVSSAEIGENLVLQVDVQPSSELLYYLLIVLIGTYLISIKLRDYL